MSEEDIETSELKESVDASVERALDAEREKTGWTVYLSLSTAIIAVFAAVASLESGANSNDAILEKNDAVLNQSKASDEWVLHQSKGIRAEIVHGESEFAAATNPTLAAALRDEALRIKAEQPALETQARALEEKVEVHNARAERLRHRRDSVSDRRRVVRDCGFDKEKAALDRGARCEYDRARAIRARVPGPGLIGALLSCLPQV